MRVAFFLGILGAATPCARGEAPTQLNLGELPQRLATDEKTIHRLEEELVALKKENTELTARLAHLEKKEP